MLTNKEIEAIKAINDSCSDNQIKCNYIKKLLKKKYKFIGLGNNRAAFFPIDNKKLVYKVALCSLGIEDNMNDVSYSINIPHYNPVYETHSSGLVSIQRRIECFTEPYQIRPYYSKILSILAKMSKEYVLVDVSPLSIQNYGLYKGELVIADGSDCFPIGDSKPLICNGVVRDKKDKLTTCDTPLEYDELYFKLVCPYCGKRFNPSLFKIKAKEVNIMKDKYYSTGLSDTEEEALNSYIINSRTKQVTTNSDEKEYTSEYYVEDEIGYEEYPDDDDSNITSFIDDEDEETLSEDSDNILPPLPEEEELYYGNEESYTETQDDYDDEYDNIYDENDRQNYEYKRRNKNEKKI